MKNPVELFKWIRKKKYIEKKYSGKYAFVGIGNHSINNLYPVLNYLRVPLKYIVCRTEKTTLLVKNNYPDVIATTDYTSVLEDNEINGIFICTDPKEHYQLVKTALLQKKNVFVEKPLCLSSKELNNIIDIQKQNGNICLTGLQRRYSTCGNLLKKKLPKENIISYNYKFLAGAYPEGNILWDIFIHPVDFLYFLFGEYEIISSEKKITGKGQSSIIMLTKHRGITGVVEMSTSYSWKYPKEELCINTQSGIYEMINLRQLTYSPKPTGILPLPMEKIFDTVPVKSYLFDSNSFLPVFGNNELVTLGYFNEIQNYMDLCENKKAVNLSSPETLKCTYSIIENLLK